MTTLALSFVLCVAAAVFLIMGDVWLALACAGLLLLVMFFGFIPRRPRFEEPRPFKDTPEAWKAREVVPGETREEARKRLEQYREN